MATADLVVEMVRPARGPWIEARAVLRRRGRTTLVVEALVFETGAAGPPTAPVAWASMTFALLPARTEAVGDESPSVDVAPEMPARWAFTGDGFERPVLESLGVEVIDALAGRLSMPALPYHRNSFGAVQGGAMALLAEAAGAEAMRAARGPDAGPFAVTGLQVAYLALGRDGPITSRARVLDPSRGSLVLCSGGALRRRLGRPGDHARQRGRRLGVTHVANGTGYVPDPRRVVGDYFRLERWEIPPPAGVDAPSEFGGRVPVDAHQRGPGGGLVTGGLLTSLDNLGGFTAGIAVLPEWVVTTSMMVTVSDLSHAGRSACTRECCAAGARRWSPASTWSTKGRTTAPSRWPP